MLDRLTKTLRLRLNAGATPKVVPLEAVPAIPPEQHLARAFLKLTSREGLVYLTADFSPESMLRLVGSLGGTASAVSSQVGDRPASVVSFPLDCPTRQERIQVTAVHSGTPNAEYELIRATHRRVPEGQAVEVVYAHGDAQSRYLIELPSGVEVTGFKDFCRTRPVFEEVPPVTQMVAFLKATIHQRRTTLRSLATMARRSGEAPLTEMVAAMEEQLSGGHDFSNPGIGLARAVLEAHGRTVYPNTVAALCVLCDIYLGNLGPAQLKALVEGEYETSAEAVRAAVEFLGVRGSSRVWRELRPEGLSAPRWREASRAARFLQATLGRRTALTILQDLADDSGSERSRERVTRLLDRVPQDQILVNDEHLALHAYLAARGRTIQTETIAAMGIYVDFEAGILSVEDIDSLTPQRGFWDTSLYGMLAIAGAFDRELRAFHLPGRSTQRWQALARLVVLSEGGAVARFVEKGQPGYTTVHLNDRLAVEQCKRDGLRFSGEVMACLPTLDYLHEADLHQLTAEDQEVIACFGSDDRRLQWRRIAGPPPQSEAAEEILHGEFSYIDGYRVYHFLSSVVGRLTPAPAEPPRSGVIVYRDQRGSAQYHHQSGITSRDALHQAPQHGWEWAEEMVEFPSLEGLPRTFEELSHDHILGRPEKHTVEQSRLDWILAGVRDLLTEPWPYRHLADYPAQLGRLHEALASTSVAAVLAGLVSDREALLARLSQKVPELEVAEPLLEALSLPEATEFAALALLHLATAEPADRFRELLLDRLYHLADTEDLALRGLACRLIGSSVLARDEERQLAARYVLTRCLDQDRPEVAVSAARTLAALALEDVEPLKPLALLAPLEGKPPDRYILVSSERLASLHAQVVASWQAFAANAQVELPELLRQRSRSELLASYREALPDLPAEIQPSLLPGRLRVYERPPAVPDGSRLLGWSGRERPEPQDLQLKVGERFIPLIHPDAVAPEQRADFEGLHAALVAQRLEERRGELDYNALAHDLVTFFNLPPDHHGPVRTMLVGVFAGGEPETAEPQVEETLSPLELKLQASERALYEAEQRLVSLTRQVHDDPVTGLPGALVMELTQRYAREPAAVLVCRLRGDDGQLRDWTRAMADALGHEGLLGRTGPDEFTVSLPRLEDPVQVAVRVGRLRGAAGGGVAFGVDLGGRVEGARQALDLALEHGQELRFFDDQVQAEFMAGASLEYELWHALDNQEFAVHYQPVVELGSGRVVGFESLLRWHHPQRGLLLPGEFLATADAIGLWPGLTDWQLDQVGSLARRHPEVWFSVNRLAAPDTGLVAELLPGDPVPARTRIAWDGLGPRAWPLTELHGGGFAKLDRSVVATIPQDSRTAFAIVSLARSLRLEPVAVGVETVAQRQFLQAIGCELGQGFLFSEAVARTRVAEVLEQGF